MLSFGLRESASAQIGVRVRIGRRFVFLQPSAILKTPVLLNCAITLYIFPFDYCNDHTVKPHGEVTHVGSFTGPASKALESAETKQLIKQ